MNLLKRMCLTVVNNNNCNQLFSNVLYLPDLKHMCSILTNCVVLPVKQVSKELKEGRRNPLNRNCKTETKR